jgi:hypothetical protein
MNNIDAIMPCEEPITPTFLQCGHCKDHVDANRVGFYEGCDICDGCAETLRPSRYNAELEGILAAADEQCKSEIGCDASIARFIADGTIPLIEDEFGDLLYCSPNCPELFTTPAVLSDSTIGYLPEEIRLAHRRTHRQAINESTPKEYMFTAKDEHWTGEFHPFEAGAQTFTLTLLSKLA